MLIIIHYTGAMGVLFLKDISRLRHVCKILFAGRSSGKQIIYKHHSISSLAKASFPSEKKEQD